MHYSYPCAVPSCGEARTCTTPPLSRKTEVRSSSRTEIACSLVVVLPPHHIFAWQQKESSDAGSNSRSSPFRFFLRGAEAKKELSRQKVLVSSSFPDTVTSLWLPHACSDHLTRCFHHLWLQQGGERDPSPQRLAAPRDLLISPSIPHPLG